MTTAKDVMKMIKDNDVKYVDFRFTDPRGKWQHVTFDVSMIEEETFAEGQMFDGSSIAGWKAINESDMNLMPDPATACIDPFFAETTLSLVCDVLEPTTGEPYNRDPRGIAKKAEGMVKAPASATPFSSARKPNSSCSTTSNMPPSRTRPASSSTRSNCRPIPTPNTKAAISATASAPRRVTSRCRRRTPRRTCAAKCSAAMAKMGVKVEKHHHEVGSAQHELGMKFSPLDPDGRPDDDLQILHPAGRADLRQDRNLHAEADLRRQRLGHALPSVDLEGRQAGYSPETNMPISRRCACPTSPASSSTPSRSMPSPTRPPTPTSGWCRVSRRRCCSPIRAQSLGLVPHSVYDQSEGQARRGPLPRSARQSVSRLRRDADGGP